MLIFIPVQFKRTIYKKIISCRKLVALNKLLFILVSLYFFEILNKMTIDKCANTSLIKWEKGDGRKIGLS